MVDESACGADMTVVLGGRPVIGPPIIEKIQGPKGNAAKELWLVTKGLRVMLGGMEEEVFDPSSDI